MIAMHDHRQDGQHQRQGVDRSVVMDNGKMLWIDEKVRFRNPITGRIYQDIALEEWSSISSKSPGWVLKSLLCDYIAYAIAPLGKCYLLPVLQLQTAWRVHGEEWKLKYPAIQANNSSWITLSWGIPVPILFRAIGDCLRVNFDPHEQLDIPF
jgi:hypothetical protein